MPVVELIMPKMGESVMEATIIAWHKNEGDMVEEDETILEVATDKVDTEIPSPHKGILKKILHDVDDVVAIGKALALIETEQQKTGRIASQEDQKEHEVPVSKSTAGEVKISPESQPPKEATRPAPSSSFDEPKKDVGSISVSRKEMFEEEGRFYSPLVRNIARTEGISQEELDQIEGTGGNGRVTKYDILNYIKRGRKIESVKPAPKIRTRPPRESERPVAPPMQPDVQSPTEASPEPVITAPQQLTGDQVEIIEMDRMRKLIASHMIQSKQISAHVTSFVEADVTNMVRWRNRVKDDFAKNHGTKLTFTPLFLECVIKAIHEFPKMNASVDGDKILLKKNLNIGVATARPDGNLIVPVVKNADELSLLGLAKRVNDLTERARNKKLLPEEIQGGTFTISNIGTFGNLMGTPIINQPQVAVLAPGAIQKKPVILESKGSDTIAIRHMMFLSLSYDHRIIDGYYGGTFLQRIANYIEEFDPDRAL